MEAFGRPVSEPPPERRRPERIRLEDGPALFFATLFGLLAGFAIGYEVFRIGVLLILAPGVLTVLASLVCRRPPLPSIIAGFVSCAMAGMIGIPVLVMRILGGIWS